jgi:hypothetical protein
MLDAWLKEMEKRWRLSTLLNQVCIVDRFLDHLVEIGLIADNPLPCFAVSTTSNKASRSGGRWLPPIPTRPSPRCDALHPSAACWATSCAIMSR